jgi:hypothetical protein
VDSIKVLNVTSHLGGGLGTAISTYIARSTLTHSVLELEKSINPCTDQISIDVKTLKNRKDFAKHIVDYDVLLIHYYCHPLIVWALMEINRIKGNKVVVWCHNNGKDILRPLPDNLGKMADLVILSGCKDERFDECEVIRPSPTMSFLDKAAHKVSKANKDDKLSFRYIGSLDKSKISDCAFEWFGYLSEKWGFDIATLDSSHNFSRFRVLVGETKRSVLYDHFFCLVYPLRDNHYGCGELGLQELLMLGYPAIIRRNSVETEIVDGLSGVYFADSMNELASVCLEINANWSLLIENWRARSDHNVNAINLRKPYERLDSQLLKIYGSESSRKRIIRKPDSLDIVKFAYNIKSNENLDKILSLWNQSGLGKNPAKSSPVQFLKYFPMLKSLISPNQTSKG